MRYRSAIILACAALGLAACQANAPAAPQVSKAVRTDSGIDATGSAGPQGGALAAPSGTGAVATSPAK